jgi:hypothetical protein
MPADLVPGKVLKVLDHHLALLADVVWVQAHEAGQRLGRLLALDVGVVLGLLDQLVVGLVGDVILQHVLDEAFLNRLAHGVAVEGLAIAAEDRQRLVFGRRGEGEKAHVRLLASLGHGAEQALKLALALLLGHLPRLAAQLRAAQHTLELRRRLARLRAVRLIDDHRVPARGQMALAAFAALLAQLGQLPGHERKLLQRGDDDRHAGFQRLGELARILVDLLHHALAVVELVNGVLQLPVQHHPVGDDHHAVEHPLIAFVVQAGQAVRQPGNRIALAAAGRVLNQIVMSHTFAGSGCHHLAHRLQLVIAREDQAFLA